MTAGLLEVHFPNWLIGDERITRSQAGVGLCSKRFGVDQRLACVGLGHRPCCFRRVKMALMLYPSIHLSS